MTRPVAIAALLVLSVSVPLSADYAVEVTGAFVRSGTFTEVGQVRVNQPVQLIVRVRDTSDVPQGVAGGKVDVAWNHNVLQLQDVVDDDAGNVSDVQPLFNQNVWKAFFSGWRVDPTDSNLYADPNDPNNPTLVSMGAGQTPPGQLSLDQPQTFFTLTFLPIAEGPADLKLTGYEFAVIPANPNPSDPPSVPLADVSNPALTVVADQAPDPGQDDPPVTPAGPMCFGPAMAVGALMLGGCSGMLRRRRCR